MIPGQPNNVSNILPTFRPQERWVKKAHNHGVFSTYPTFPTFLPQDNTPICFQIRTGLPTEEREKRSTTSRSRTLGTLGRSSKAPVHGLIRPNVLFRRTLDDVGLNVGEAHSSAARRAQLPVTVRGLISHPAADVPVTTPYPAAAILCNSRKVVSHER